MIKHMKKYLEPILKPIIENVRDKRATHYIKKVSRKSIHQVVKVAFIVFEPESWDKLQPVYEAMAERKNFEPWLIVVPSYDNNLSLEKTYGYEKKFFEEKYNNIILAYDKNGNVVEMEQLGFDYVFYQDPYNVHYPKEIRSKSVVKYSKICYIPYGYTISTNFSDLFLQNKDFFRNVSVFFADSASVRDVMREVFGKNYNRGIQKIQELGYPPFERYENMKDSAQVATIAWAPRWSYDEKVGGSHFFEYKDGFVSLRKRYPEINLIFRPHPMLFANMINIKKMTRQEVDDYKELLKMNNIITMDKDPINAVLGDADILISDISSVIPSYFMTGRPVIYCKSSLEVNNEFKELLEGIYIANSWEDVETYVSEITAGNDYLKEKRKNIINNGLFSIHKNSTAKVLEYLKKDN